MASTPVLINLIVTFRDKSFFLVLIACLIGGKCHMGLDMEAGAVGDMREQGITESFSVKRQMLLSAAEAAEMILRVDDIIKCAPRQVSCLIDLKQSL